jgi:hypothetical protein
LINLGFTRAQAPTLSVSVGAGFCGAGNNCYQKTIIDHMPPGFTVYSIAITACAVILGYLVHHYEPNRTLALLMTNLLALTALLAIVSKIPWTE